MDKKYQVFISSTYVDLIAERQAALRAVLDQGHIPAGMEGFYAADEQQLSYIKRVIDECDYYMVIIAGMYGSVDKDGLSFTEREYAYAVKMGIPVLAFIRDRIDGLEPSRQETNSAKISALSLFKDEVSRNWLVSFWNNCDQLQVKIAGALSQAVRDNPRTGWVRGNQVASSVIIEELHDTKRQLATAVSDLKRAQNSLTPEVSDLAGLEHPVTLRYEFHTNNRSQPANAYFITTWQDIFVAVAPQFF